MTSYQEGIPERELTFQYKPLTGLGEASNTPEVANGLEIKLFCESIKEIFQKEPMTQALQKGPDSHYEGDKTLVTDTLDAKHTFEITGWVYSNKQGKHSLDSGILSADGTEASTTTDTITAENFNQYTLLGDTEIKYDSESVSVKGGSSLKRGFRKNIANVSASADRFTVEGDETSVLSNGDPLKVSESTGNDGDYTADTVAYNSSTDQTEINVQEDVTDSTADGKIAANDYEINYNLGQIRYFDNGNITTTTKTTKFLGNTITSRTVIDVDFEISYTFNASANNIARLIRRMSQLGNPFVMRLDKTEFTAESGETGRDYLVIPKKVNIVSKASKPDEYKLELELRKGTIEQ